MSDSAELTSFDNIKLMVEEALQFNEIIRIVINRFIEKIVVTKDSKIKL